MSLPLAWACYLPYYNLLSDTGILVGSYKILCQEDGTTVIDFRLMLDLLSPTANLGLKLSPLTNLLPRCDIKLAQLKAISSSLRGVEAPLRS
jgi:hypothetical protein